jgi:hypothetical protein
MIPGTYLQRLGIRFCKHPVYSVTIDIFASVTINTIESVTMGSIDIVTIGSIDIVTIDSVFSLIVAVGYSAGVLAASSQRSAATAVCRPGDILAGPPVHVPKVNIQQTSQLLQCFKSENSSYCANMQ